MNSVPEGVPVPGSEVKSEILLVDDSATIRAGLSRGLSAEVAIKEAVDGEQAWEILQQNNLIELVITDLDMPKVDGFELIERIRASDQSRIANTPIIVVTGAEDTQAKHRAYVAGANDFISKNVDKVELLARVHSLQYLARTIRDLEASRLAFQKQADTDVLTKLTNRRSFFSKATECLTLMRRHQEDFSVLMLDIDRFKAINDAYGHQAGDYILVQVAQILNQNIRANDVLARIGGEEFAIALPYSNRLASVVLAERLRTAINSGNFEFAGKIIPVTVSLGIATVEKSVPCAIESLLGIADQRLYRAKRRGRNRLCASDNIATSDASHDINDGCPKLDQALTMIKHGNEHEIDDHLYMLIREAVPLFKLGNKHHKDLFDIDALQAGVSALEKLQKSRKEV